MGQPPRKWLKPRVFFNTAKREVIRAKFAALRFEHGERGNPWLADRIADFCQEEGIATPERETFRQYVHRFMKNRIRVGDEIVEKFAPFAATLPYQPTPAIVPMMVELAVNDKGEAIVFHPVHFPYLLSWLEFDIDFARLSFVMREGAYRELGIQVRSDLAVYMRRAERVLMVLVDPISGDPIEGVYIDLRVFRQSAIEGSAVRLEP